MVHIKCKPHAALIANPLKSLPYRALSHDAHVAATPTASSGLSDLPQQTNRSSKTGALRCGAIMAGGLGIVCPKSEIIPQFSKRMPPPSLRPSYSTVLVCLYVVHKFAITLLFFYRGLALPLERV